MIITWDPCSNNDVGCSGREVVQTRERKAISKCTLSTRSLIFLRSLRTFLDHHSGEEILSWVIIGMAGRATDKHDNILELQSNPFSSCVDLYGECLLPACARPRKEEKETHKTKSDSRGTLWTHSGIFYLLRSLPKLSAWDSGKPGATRSLSNKVRVKGKGNEKQEGKHTVTKSDTCKGRFSRSGFLRRE